MGNVFALGAVIAGDGDCILGHGKGAALSIPYMVVGVLESSPHILYLITKIMHFHTVNCWHKKFLLVLIMI